MIITEVHFMQKNCINLIKLRTQSVYAVLINHATQIEEEFIIKLNKAANINAAWERNYGFIDLTESSSHQIIYIYTSDDNKCFCFLFCESLFVFSSYFF